MGWASGSLLMTGVIYAVNKTKLTADQQRTFFPVAIDALENADCDTLMDCLGENAIYDECLEKLYREKGWWEEEE